MVTSVKGCPQDHRGTEPGHSAGATTPGRVQAQQYHHQREIPPGSETLMTSRITAAAVVTAHAEGCATLPWVPTLTRRQRRSRAARIAQPSTTYHLTAARP